MILLRFHDVVISPEVATGIPWVPCSFSGERLVPGSACGNHWRPSCSGATTEFDSGSIKFQTLQLSLLANLVFQGLLNVILAVPNGKPAVLGIYWGYFSGAGQFQAIAGNGSKTPSSGYLKPKQEAFGKPRFTKVLEEQLGGGKEDILSHDVSAGRKFLHCSMNTQTYAACSGWKTCQNKK